MNMVRLGAWALLAFLSTFALAPASAQQAPIAVWPRGAPNAPAHPGPETVRVTEGGDHVLSNIHVPTLTPYLPTAETATGASVIVMPGGGHRELWIDHEGYNVAQWLSAHGVAAFVLKYRLSRAPDSSYTLEGDSLADAQRAIRLVRSRAGEWGLAPDAVGVMGFSAGGELAALAGTRFDTGSVGARGLAERQSAKPSFMALVYPGLHSELNLSADTPPAFLLAGGDDRPDIADGLPRLYLAMRDAGVSAELHVLAGVGHGFGVRDTNPPQVAAWLPTFYNWLNARGFLAKESAAR
jgi:acetyl esterase/lipase